MLLAGGTPTFALSSESGCRSGPRHKITSAGFHTLSSLTFVQFGNDWLSFRLDHNPSSNISSFYGITHGVETGLRPTALVELPPVVYEDELGAFIRATIIRVWTLGNEYGWLVMKLE